MRDMQGFINSRQKYSFHFRFTTLYSYLKWQQHFGNKQLFRNPGVPRTPWSLGHQSGPHQHHDYDMDLIAIYSQWHKWWLACIVLGCYCRKNCNTVAKFPDKPTNAHLSLCSWGVRKKSKQTLLFFLLSFSALYYLSPTLPTWEDLLGAEWDGNHACWC